MKISFPYVISVIFVIVMAVCGFATESEEELPGWSTFVRGSDYYGDYATFRRYKLHECLDYIDRGYPINENHIFESLVYHRGEAAQKARLLYWMKETEPELRKEYLLQWLSERKELPPKEWVKGSLTELLSDRTQESIDMRMEEVDEIFIDLPERHKKIQEDTLLFKYAVDEIGDLEILDRLTEEMLLNPDDSIRKILYQEVYPPMRKRQGPKERAEGAEHVILRCLFMRESDTAILQHLLTEISDLLNTYPSAEYWLDLEKRLAEGETIEPPEATGIWLEYDEAERKRRHNIGFLNGVVIPRKHTWVNCCDLCKDAINEEAVLARAAAEKSKDDRTDVAQAENGSNVVAENSQTVSTLPSTSHQIHSETAFIQKMREKEVLCPGKYGGHQQGMATDRKTALFWSHTVALAKTDLNGELLKVVEVPNHSGDLEYHDGKIYVATNLGDFNREGGKRDSWIYVYDAEDLELLEKHPVNEVEFGAGGIAWNNGRFIVIGGLPKTHQQNYVYEYDEKFKFLKRHDLPTGYTAVGIQTAAYHDGYWWFGCYGLPDNPGLLQVDQSFKLVAMYNVNYAWGIIGLEGKTLLQGGEWGSAKALQLKESNLFKRKADEGE